MSFAFMPVYTGDYLRDTPHLSMSEHGAYFKLLMFCWDQKGPLPLDERKLMGICNARSTDEIEAFRRVLSEFFICMDDGWYNKRMAEEVARAEKISHQNSDAGKKSAKVRTAIRAATRAQRPLTTAQRPLNERASPVGTLTLTPTLTTTLTPSPTPTPKTPRSKDCAPTVPSGVSEQVWADFLQTRKQLRAAVTPTAINGIEREAAKAGLSLSEALQMCCARGWRGFKAEWVTQAKAGQKERVKAMLFGKEIDHETQ